MKYLACKMPSGEKKCNAAMNEIYRNLKKAGITWVSPMGGISDLVKSTDDITAYAISFETPQGYGCSRLRGELNAAITGIVGLKPLTPSDIRLSRNYCGIYCVTFYFVDAEFFKAA